MKIFSPMGQKRKEFLFCSWKRAFVYIPLPLPSFYLSTDRIFREPRQQRVFNRNRDKVQSRIPWKQRYLQLGSRGRAQGTRWACGGRGFPQASGLPRAARPLPKVSTNVVCLSGRPSAYSTFPEWHRRLCSLGFLSHVIFCLGV